MPIRTVLRESGGFVYWKSNPNLPYYDIQFHNKAIFWKGDNVLMIGMAWIYVVGMVAIVEATSSTGTLLGAVLTLLLYGVLPLAIVAYLYFTPARRRLRRAADAAQDSARVDRDQRGHPAGDAVAPEREEP